MKARILIVEDERRLVITLRDRLTLGLGRP